MTTKANCAKKIVEYLGGAISHEDLLNWADAELVNEDFPDENAALLLDVLSDLSASRVPGFVSPESYRDILKELGFRIETKLVPA